MMQQRADTGQRRGLSHKGSRYCNNVVKLNMTDELANPNSTTAYKQYCSHKNNKESKQVAATTQDYSCNDIVGSNHGSNMHDSYNVGSTSAAAAAAAAGVVVVVVAVAVVAVAEAVVAVAVMVVAASDHHLNRQESMKASIPTRIETEVERSRKRVKKRSFSICFNIQNKKRSVTIMRMTMSVRI